MVIAWLHNVIDKNLHVSVAYARPWKNYGLILKIGTLKTMKFAYIIWNKT